MTLQDPQGGLKEFQFLLAGIWAWIKIQRGESGVTAPGSWDMVLGTQCGAQTCWH